MNRDSIRKRWIDIIIILILLLTVFFTGAVLSAPVNAEEENDIGTFDAANDLATALNIAGLESQLVLDENDTELMENAEKERTKSEGQQEWLATLSTMESMCVSNHFTYSGNGPKSSYSAALHSNKKVNCAVYVSWALQRLGALPNGYAFYISGSLHGGAANYIKNSDKFTVYYNVGKPANAGLEPGDIVGWRTHTCVYAGKDANGNMLWYTAGSKDVSSKNYGPKTKGYSNKNITVLIRINYDKL